MNIFTIYLARLLSFFSPCVLPIIPVYFYSMTDENNHSWKKLFPRGVVFCLGFIVVFIIMGIGAGGLSSVIIDHKAVINLIAGIIILLLALDFIGVINIPFLQKNYTPKYSRLKTSMPFLNSFILGLLFALTWSPCIGAVLGGILTYVSAVSGNAIQGGWYLFVYGIGLSTPLLVASFFFEKLKGFTGRNHFFVMAVKKILGLVLVIFALMLFSQVLKLADIENKKELEHASNVLIPNKLPVFLTLMEPDCESCKDMTTIIEKLKNSCGNKTIEFRDVDIKNQNYAYIAIELGIIGTPTYVILSEQGEELIRFAGGQTIETLNSAIKKVTGKNCY